MKSKNVEYILASSTGSIVRSPGSGNQFWGYEAVTAGGSTIEGEHPAILRSMVPATCGYGFAAGAPGNVLLAFGLEGRKGTD
jgi:hypothetical protein